MADRPDDPSVPNGPVPVDDAYQDVRASVRDFVDREIRPICDELDNQDQEIPLPVIGKMAELDPAILSAVKDSAGKNFEGHRIHRDLGGHERVLEAWS